VADQKSCMGLGVVARSSWENGPRHGDVARALGALVARLPHAVRACDGTVVHLSVARWQQGAVGENQWGPEVAPGKVPRSGDHRGRVSMAWLRRRSGLWRPMVAARLRWSSTSAAGSFSSRETRG
jgi:hypothetical protein